MASRSSSCGSMRPPYTICSVSAVLRGTGTGKLMMTVFWPTMRRYIRRPSCSEYTLRTVSESASRSVSDDTTGAMILSHQPGAAVDPQPLRAEVGLEVVRGTS